ncbi:MAG: hypothetical protein GF355_07320 [Candidatus Eisenbacteria bacterium]|nr:hypothetical protein [Candidatus Eisenbacteria bacterium]
MSHFRRGAHGGGYRSRPQLVSLGGSVGAERFLRMAAWIGLSLLLTSCGDEAATPPEAPAAPRIALLAPLDGQQVADTLQAEAAIENEGELDRMTLLVDDAAVQTRWAPPWTFCWPGAGVHDSTWVSVEIRAYDQSGAMGRSPRIQVQLVPNRTPLVRIVYPYPDHYVSAETLHQRPWICLAADPDEAELPDDHISWRDENLGLLGVGRSLDASGLGLGLRRIQVEVRDRWGRRARDRRRVTIFLYPSPDTPQEALNILCLAIRAREPQRLSEILHPQFTWTFCGCPVDSGVQVLERSAALQILSELLEHPQLQRLSWTWRISGIEDLEIGDSTASKAEIRGFSVLVEWEPPREEPLVSSRENAARIYLYRGSGGWQVRQWTVFPPAEPYPGDSDLYSVLVSSGSR